MNNILKDINELKDLILNSEEYINYSNSVKELDKDNEIKDLIENITVLQKNIVKKMSKKEDVKSLEKDLDDLYNKLYNIEKYSKYIDNSKKLNILITNIQKEFEEYFNSLVS